ncbi:MAG: hypothetical protein PHR25_06840, partial [Clostridia bacterium]|nr:hypothetical protein [Clostridia bacterium]
MKNKGISLIVFVITIIVMIILAGSIILSLSNNGIIEKAKQAKDSSDFSNLKHAASLIEADLQIQLSTGKNPLTGKTRADYYKEKLIEQGFNLDKYVISNIGNEVIIEQLNVKDIIADGYNVFALLNNDTVLAWGKNNYGHLGVGDLIDKNSPVQIPKEQLSNVKEITVGSSSVYALLHDGTVKSWGSNSYGQLGIGDLVDKSSPVQIPTDKLSDVKQIIAASSSVYALLNDGTVKSWGYNSSGQLGLGDTVNRNTPTQIPGLSNVKIIKPGSGCIYAILNDGTVKSWGYNSNGRLGLGDTVNRNTPTQIPGLSNVNKIETGSGRVYAILNDGTVKGWGYNETRFLGFGNNSTAKTSPTDMPQLSNVNSIHVSGSGSFCSAYAVLNDGTMFSWGHNGHRILGFGHTSDIYYPTQVSTSNLSNVKEMHTINFSCLALLKDGTIKSWAYNNPGSLGLGHNYDVTYPTLIPNLSNVKKLSTYFYSAY